MSTEKELLRAIKEEQMKFFRDRNKEEAVDELTTTDRIKGTREKKQKGGRQKENSLTTTEIG